MKKLLFLLSVILLASCGCVYPQIPPQYLQIDSTCGAALPDYLPMIRVTDNCQVVSIEQSPSAGSWLTIPTTTVLIRATDNFNNHTDLMFTVTLTDTIGPEIDVLDSTLLVKAYDTIDGLYDMADRMLAQQVWFEESMASDTLPTADEDYCNGIMLTWTDPCKAFTGEGFRIHTFIGQRDTVIIQPKIML